MVAVTETDQSLHLIKVKPLAQRATNVITAEIKAAFPTTPKVLNILIDSTHNAASCMHASVLQTTGEEVGVKVATQEFNLSTPLENIHSTIMQANTDPQVLGIVFENPPQGFEDKYNPLKRQVDPLKDIDGALGEDSPFTHATAVASLWIAQYSLDKETKDLASLSVGVVGSEGNVGNSLLWALNRLKIPRLTGYDVRIRNPNTTLPWATRLTSSLSELWEQTRQHEVLFTAASDQLTKLIQRPGVREGALVIDIGGNVVSDDHDYKDTKGVLVQTVAGTGIKLAKLPTVGKMGSLSLFSNLLATKWLP